MPQTLDDLRAQVNKMLDSADQHSPISATVRFRVQKLRERDFLASAETLSNATWELPGVSEFGYHLHRPLAAEQACRDVVEYLIYEDWQTVAQFKPQWNSAHLKLFQSVVGDYLSDAPLLMFYHGTPERHPIVLATGQTRCWDGAGAPIACDGSGADGDIRAGAKVVAPRFIDNNNGTVTDGLTGLIWLADANLFGDVSWDNALKNAGSLQADGIRLTDGSKAGDWRLPNLNELQSLLTLNNASGPAIDPSHQFINLQCANYWSSSTVVGAPPLGWYTALAVGPPVFDLKANTMRMWPVRGATHLPQTGETICFDSNGQPVDCAGSGQDAALHMGIPFPAKRFTDNGDGTVKDELTGLLWLRNANAFGTRTWQGALEACNGLASGANGLNDGSSAGDWRLPNFNELRSIADYGNYAPALPTGHPFQGVRPSLYWSSTSVPSAPNLARFVFIGMGPGVWDHKKVLLNVWPVRDDD